MAAAARNPFAIAIESFVVDIKRNEDTQTPFYKEVIAQAWCAAESGSQEVNHAEQLSTFIEDLAQKHERESKTLWVSKKLGPFVAGMNEYAKACDVMIQAAPSAVVLLYGGARLVLLMASSIIKAFDSVLAIMEQIGHLLKPYELFSRAYHSSTDMQSLLVESYKNIITFWQKASKLLSRKKYKLFASSLVKPLDTEWQKCSDGLKQDSINIQRLAQATEAMKSQERDEKKENKKQQELRKQIVGWIKSKEDDATVDLRRDMDANLGIRYGHSCEWLLEHPDFRAWKDATETTSLWYSAPPGTGKTILTSTIARHLQDRGFKTATFFFSFSDTVKRKPLTAIRCLALQLLTHTVSIPDKVLRLYEEDLEHHCLGLSNPRVAIEVCETLMKHIGRIHILVDGLDECGDFAPEQLARDALGPSRPRPQSCCAGNSNDRQQMFDFFCRLLNAKTLGIVKWFFSSRPELDIRASMQKHNVTIIEPPMTDLLGDIGSYVRTQMENKLGRHCEVCVEYWTTASEGNFLWVTLMLQIMEGEGTACDEEIEEELEKFPRGLTGCYLRSLNHLINRPERLQQLARRIFAMVVGAVQPLRLSEISQALAATPAAKGIPRANVIEELCSNLIVFDRSQDGDKSDPLLKIPHKSIYDFFQQDPRSLGAREDLHQFFISPKAANLELGLSSLTYLMDARYQQKQDVAQLLNVPEHSFLKHAAIFWYWYLSHADHSQAIFENVRQFLKSPAFGTCVTVQSELAPHLFARYSQTGRSCFQPELSGADSKETEGDVSYAVPLPSWLDEYEPDGFLIDRAICNFVMEWHAVLNSYPSALERCLSNQDWYTLMPGWNTWASKRANSYALCPKSLIDLDYAQLIIKDLQATRGPSEQMTAVLFGLQITDTGILPQWLRVDVGPEGLIPSEGSRPKSPVATGYNSDGVFFSRRHAWGSHCSVLNLEDLRVETLHFEAGTPTAFVPEALERHQSHLRLGKWHVLSQSNFHVPNNASVDQRGVALHCESRDPYAYSDAPREDSTYGSLTASSHDSSEESDDSASDAGSSDSEEQQQLRHAMVFLDGASPPIYVFWKQSTRHFQSKCAFHPTELLAVWSHSAQELCITHLDSGRTESTVLPEPAEVKLSSASAMRKEFYFSETGDHLFYLLYLASETPTGLQQTVSVSSFNFALVEGEGYLLSRRPPTHTISYECSGSLQYPLLLTSWSSAYLYIALPSLACKPKMLRIRLSYGSTLEEKASTGFQTLRDPIFFPHSSPRRDPKIRMLEDYQSKGQDTLTLLLNAEISRNAPGLNGSSKPRRRPELLTWDIASENDWRDWDPKVDAQPEELETGKSQIEILRGTFVDSKQRFHVPIRSGLNWTKKAFLSCA